MGTEEKMTPEAADLQRRIRLVIEFANELKVEILPQLLFRQIEVKHDEEIKSSEESEVGKEEGIKEDSSVHEDVGGEEGKESQN